MDIQTIFYVSKFRNGSYYHSDESRDCYHWLYNQDLVDSKSIHGLPFRYTLGVF